MIIYLFIDGDFACYLIYFSCHSCLPDSLDSCHGMYVFTLRLSSCFSSKNMTQWCYPYIIMSLQVDEFHVFSIVFFFLAVAYKSYLSFTADSFRHRLISCVDNIWFPLKLAGVVLLSPVTLNQDSSEDIRRHQGKWVIRRKVARTTFALLQQTREHRV